MTDEQTEDIIKRNIILKLPVKLTDAERLAAAIRREQGEANIEQLEEQKKKAKAEWDRRIADEQTNVDRNKAEVHSGEREASVECYERYAQGPNRAADTVEMVRVDTGEVVKRREPTTAERQKRMPFPNVLGTSTPADLLEEAVETADSDGDVDLLEAEPDEEEEEAEETPAPKRRGRAKRKAH